MTWKLALLFTLVACPGGKGTDPEPEETDDPPSLGECDEPNADPSACLPTLGDKCGCIPQCMTQTEIDCIDSVCDIECETGTGLSWACEIVDGQCAVAD